MEGEGQLIFERRNHPRFVIQVPIEYRRSNSDRFRHGHTINFSETGIKVAVSEKIHPNEELAIRIHFASGSHVARSTAWVRVIWADDQAKNDGLYRVGLNFINNNQQDILHLKHFLHSYADPRKECVPLPPRDHNRDNSHKPLPITGPEGCCHVSRSRPQWLKRLVSYARLAKENRE